MGLGWQPGAPPFEVGCSLTPALCPEQRAAGPWAGWGGAAQGLRGAWPGPGKGPPIGRWLLPCARLGAGLGTNVPRSSLCLSNRFPFSRSQFSQQRSGGTGVLGTGRPFILCSPGSCSTPPASDGLWLWGPPRPAQSRVPQTPIPRGQQSWVCPHSSHYLLHPSAWTPVGPKRALALGPLHLLRTPLCLVSHPPHPSLHLFIFGCAGS